MSLEGQRIGEFEILELIGQGGMGAVYKARQTSLGRFVALKTLQASLAENPEYIARFREEARAAAGLHHANLVQVISAGESEGVHWFAMEYVEGESAKARVKRQGRFDPLEAIGIAIHVAMALEYGWRKAALIHRDVKPDNIFLSRDGEVKLGDLGLAKSAGHTPGLTLTGHSMGTPHYMSPEQVEARKDVDLRADIYSLGCTLYHLLSGQAPFDGNSAVAIMHQQMTSPAPDLHDVWPGCPRELDETVLKMMQRLPEDRQQSYEEVIANLRSAREAVGSATLPVTITATRDSLAYAKPAATGSPKGPASAGKKKPGLPSAAWIGGGVVVLAAIATFLFHFAPWLQKSDAASDGQAPRLPAQESTSIQLPGGFAALQSATQDHPFVNSLGMKFVPVPMAGATAGPRVLFSVWDTRVRDYAAYSAAQKVDDSWSRQQKDGVPVGRELNHPVVGVSWEDAQGFCQWLTEKEIAEGKLPAGMKYRLPTDEEWSWAAGLPPEPGATPAEKHQKNKADYPWGREYPPREKVGNYADETFHAKFPPRKNEKEDRMEDLWMEGYTDGYATTSPVGSYPANAYGLHDMGGNVWQWCEDWFDAAQKDRVLRGASWDYYDHGSLLSSTRNHVAPGMRNRHSGFRCVLGASAR